MILLDTSILIELFRKKNKQKAVFFQLANQGQTFSISTITYYEVLSGSNLQQDAFWQGLLKTITILPFDLECAKQAVMLYKMLKSQNKLIDLADLAIAATALANDLELATLNKKHFTHIQGLKIVN